MMAGVPETFFENFGVLTMHRPYRHSLFFRLLGVGLKIYVFTALFLTIVSFIMVMFVSTDFGLAFLNTVISPMSKTGLTLGLGIAIAIALESLAQ